MKSGQNEAAMPLHAPGKTLCGCENFHVEFFCVFDRDIRAEERIFAAGDSTF